MKHFEQIIVQFGYGDYFQVRSADSLKALVDEIRPVEYKRVGDKDIYSPKAHKFSVEVITEQVRPLTDLEELQKAKEDLEQSLKWSREREAKEKKEKEDLRCQVQQLLSTKTEEEI
jgi:hypothetical protein